MKTSRSCFKYTDDAVLSTFLITLAVKATYLPCESVSPQKSDLLWVPEPQELEHWNRKMKNILLGNTYIP